MRQPLIAGNWKMHGSRASVAQLLAGIKNASDSFKSIECAVFPPFVFLEQAERQLQGTDIAWGAQCVNPNEQGAYSGEIAASMVKDFNCRYVMVGHSERRKLYNEDDNYVAKQFWAAIGAGLRPILCVGETLKERDAGQALAVVFRQLHTVFALAERVEDLSEIVIAYEPVWAIGTGLTATPEQAQNMHQQLRQAIAGYDKLIANNIRIIYGGSIKANNVAALLAMPDIDGGLVGGASLNLAEFINILEICNKLS